MKRGRMGMKRFLLLCSAGLCAVMALLPAAAIAAGGGGEHAETSPMEWVWKIVNFAILVFVLVKFAGKPLKGYLQQRQELIEKSIKDSQEAKELARKALSEVEQRLKLKDKEVAEIIASAKESGEREKVRLVEEGEKMKEKILAQAKTNIDFEVKRAKEVIQAEAVDAAMQLAEEKIKNKLTEKDQEKLLQESLKLIEGRN